MLRAMRSPHGEPPETPKAPRPAKKRRARRSRARVVGLLGVGLDGKDGQTRVTKGDEFVLFGGSAETHERMQDLAMHLSERLRKTGKRISDATLSELSRLVREID